MYMWQFLACSLQKEFDMGPTSRSELPSADGCAMISHENQ